MQMEAIDQIVILAIFGVLLVMFLGPPVVLGVLRREVHEDVDLVRLEARLRRAAPARIAVYCVPVASGAGRGTWSPGRGTWLRS